MKIRVGDCLVLKHVTTGNLYQFIFYARNKSGTYTCSCIPVNQTPEFTFVFPGLEMSGGVHTDWFLRTDWIDVYWQPYARFDRKSGGYIRL